MRRVVIHGVVRGYRAAVLPQRLPGVWIRIETRKVAARDVEADAMTFLEDVRGRKGIDRECVDFARHQELGMITRRAVAPANDRVGEIEVESARPVGTRRIDVDQLRGEIRVSSI